MKLASKAKRVYLPGIDEDKPEDQRFYLEIKPLTAASMFEVKKAMASNAEEDSEYIAMIVTLKNGLKGWGNLYDEEGAPVAFPSDIKEVLEMFDIKQFGSITEQIHNISNLSADEKKI